MENVSKTYNNAAVLLAGTACVVAVVAHFFSPFVDDPIVYFRGIWTLSPLANLTFCVVAGLLLRFKFKNPKWWVQIIIGIIALVSLYFYRHTIMNIWRQGECFRITVIALAYLLPIEKLKDSMDRDGWKSAILFLLTTLAYCTLNLIDQRLGYTMKPEHEDLEALLMEVLTNVIPFASLPPLYFAIEFAFSKAGQRLGSKKWFEGIMILPAIYCFFGAMSRVSFIFFLERNCLILFLVQPVTIQLVIWISGLFKKRSK